LSASLTGRAARFTIFIIKPKQCSWSIAIIFKNQITLFFQVNSLYKKERYAEAINAYEQLVSMKEQRCQGKSIPANNSPASLIGQKLAVKLS
jgi:hypothetical protein